MMIPNTEHVTILTSTGDELAVVRAFMGRFDAGSPFIEAGTAGILAVDQLVMIAAPGVLPPELAVAGSARVSYQGTLWEAVTTQLTRHVYGHAHHTAVTLRRTTVPA